MNFADEEYVRLYVVDTVTWRVLPWESRAVLVLALRRFDHAGVFEFGRHGAERALSAAIDVPLDVVTRAIGPLFDEDIWKLEPDRLFWPKYIEAQNCKRSDRLRQRLSRARIAEVTTKPLRDNLSHHVSDLSRDVTTCHAPEVLSQLVTACHSLSPLGKGTGKGTAGEGREREGNGKGIDSYVGLLGRSQPRFTDTECPDEIEPLPKTMALITEQKLPPVADLLDVFISSRRKVGARCANWREDFHGFVRKWNLNEVRSDKKRTDSEPDRPTKTYEDLTPLYLPKERVLESKPIRIAAQPRKEVTDPKETPE